MKKRRSVNKSDLFKELNKKSEYRNHAEVMTNIVFQSFSRALIKNRRIEIRGFGVFFNKYYRGHEGRNPRTNEVIQVKEKVAPTFKPSKLLRDFLNS